MRQRWKDGKGASIMSVDRQGKLENYRELVRKVGDALGGESDPMVWMSTLTCLIREEFGFLWVGFYLAKGGELRIGPYQGSLACLRIPFGKGVCGASASRCETVVVPDVHKFSDHISCDTRSNSEIVVPIFDEKGDLRAVLDIDSTEFGCFDDVDKQVLEEIADRMRSLRWVRPS